MQCLTYYRSGIRLWRPHNRKTWNPYPPGYRAQNQWCGAPLPSSRRVPPCPALPMGLVRGALARVIAVDRPCPAIPPHTAPPGPLPRPSLPHVAQHPPHGVRRASARERDGHAPIFMCAIPSTPTDQCPSRREGEGKIFPSRNACKRAAGRVGRNLGGDHQGGCDRQQNHRTRDLKVRPAPPMLGDDPRRLRPPTYACLPPRTTPPPLMRLVFHCCAAHQQPP